MQSTLAEIIFPAFFTSTSCERLNSTHINWSFSVYAIESALHKMAKDILKEHKCLMLPPVLQNGIETQKTFEKVEIEIFDKELCLRPDCIAYTEKDQFI